MTTDTYYRLNGEAIESALRAFRDAEANYDSRDWADEERERYRDAAVEFAERVSILFRPGGRYAQREDTAEIQKRVGENMMDVQRLLGQLDLMRIAMQERESASNE